MAAVMEALGWNAKWSEKVRLGVDVEVKGKIMYSVTTMRSKTLKG